MLFQSAQGPLQQPGAGSVHRSYRRGIEGEFPAAGAGETCQPGFQLGDPAQYPCPDATQFERRGSGLNIGSGFGFLIVFGCHHFGCAWRFGCAHCVRRDRAQGEAPAAMPECLDYLKAIACGTMGY